MAERREQEQMYSNFYNNMKNFLYNNSKFDVRGVARTGSRTTGQHRDSSDLDVIFWIKGNPSKTQVYPSLVAELKSGLKVHADIGSSYNVIKLWKTDIKCDLVLLTDSKYSAQLNSRRYQE